MYKRQEKYGFENIIAVTSRTLCERPFAEQIERICKVHPVAILLREKDLPLEEYLRLTDEIKPICGSYQVPLILHFYPEAAEDRLHLPLGKLCRLSLSERTAYQVLGCSIHSVEEAKEAESLGATYLTAGHIYATDCKPGVPARGLDFLQEVCASVAIPVYAIGGIRLCMPEKHLGKMRPNREQMEEIYARGAAGACIMSGMMQI
jgi:thiamine-phosphate pyrophosphorylase